MTTSSPDNEDALPQTIPELVEWLEARIPEACPNLDTPERGIFFYAGQRHIVRLLKAVFVKTPED